MTSTEPDVDERTETETDTEGADSGIATTAEERNRRDRRSESAAALRPVEALRFVWTQLTSMRTALVLLFALALAAVPGSLIPQRKVSPIRVSDFLSAHPTLGPIYDHVGLFDVYSSPWFSAIYLLLFVSLVGCIVPRCLVYARALRARPPRTPRRLSRLPVHHSEELGTEDESPSVTSTLDDAERALRRQHYRIRRDDDSVAAERGYLREAGNLVFHLSLIFVLLGVAINGLYGFRGTSTIVVGQGFANNLSQYDDISAGAAFTDTRLKPFTLDVQQFLVKFETGDVQLGAAREFKATIGVTDVPGDAEQTEILEVNHPLHVDGTTVHLLGHGYAPVVTVTDGNGDVAYSGPVVFLPQDGNFTSAGVVKVPDGRPERLAFQAIFTPTGVDGSGPQSVFPDWYNPLLYLNAFAGPPGVETGRPENVYSLDTTGLTQLRSGDKPLAFVLKPGQTRTLPDGKGTIRFDGVQRWVKLQIGDAPGLPLVLGSVALAVTGLCFSLFIRPRRIWVRARRDGPRTLIEIGGLDRADARTGLESDVARIAAELAGRPAPTAESELSRAG